MKLKCIWTKSDELRFFVGKSYEVVGSERNFGKLYYTVRDETSTPYNVPLDSRTWGFELDKGSL